MNFGGNPPSKDTIVFCRKTKPSNFFLGFNSQPATLNEENSQKLFLLSKHCEFSIFDNIPKKFTISTKSSTCHFNLQMLKETSPVIKKFVHDNPNETNFFLNINDEDNVLGKFEQLYLGKTVVFDEDELPTSQRITKILQISNCPNYLKPESLKSREIDTGGFSSVASFPASLSSGVEIYLTYFLNYVNRSKFQRFQIKTRRKTYKCNIFGVCSSEIIRQILDESPKTKEYFYDYEDESDDFQAICDFINFKKVDITSDNMDSIKEIAEDLQINCIMKQIDNYINNYAKFSQKIDEQQTQIETIDTLFHLLTNIKTLGIESVRNSIVHSKWSQTEENVQELAAFILQIVKPTISLQAEMAELLIELNKKAKETNQLHVLIPFIVHNLMSFHMSNNTILKKKLPSPFGKSGLPFSFRSNASLDQSSAFSLYDKYVYSFIRILYKKGIIPKERIIEKLKDYDCQNRVLNAFFLPEIVEANPNNVTALQEYPTYSFGTCRNGFITFVKDFLPDKIDQYEQMLDNMEPSDEITQSIIYDDVATLQALIAKNGIDISSFTVPYNIFDDFDEQMSLMDYAAYRGSIECFKYLSLNMGSFDENTQYAAVFGGNNEIIRIVEGKIPFGSTPDVIYNDFFPPQFGASKGACNGKYGYRNIISPAITFHRNELFDWLFGKLYVNNKQLGNDLENVATFAASSGNAHALIEMIDKGFDISVSSKDIVYSAAKNGFYQLTQLLLGIIDQKLKKSPMPFTKYTPDYLAAVNFGNLSIFKLFFKQMNRDTLEESISFAITKDYKQIINYVFDNISEINCTIDSAFAQAVLTESLRKNTDEYFNFLVSELQKINPDLLTLNLYVELLDSSCLYSNFPATKTITDFILNKAPTRDFSSAFLKASSSSSMNICQYFIDKKVYINYNQLSTQVSELGSIDVELFRMIIDNINPNLKYKFLKCIDQAILAKNVKLIKFLLNEKAPTNKALFNAVSTRDLEIVDLILSYNSKPSFINQKTHYGTAMHLAVQENSTEIVKRLLSVPGIDPSISNHKDDTPLTLAIRNVNYLIFDALISFFEDKIDDYIWTIIKTLKTMNKHCFYEKLEDETPWRMLERILSIKSINPNFYDHSTFLYQACLFNQPDMVEFLLSLEKIDVNKCEASRYYTPLMIAIEKQYPEIVKLLLDHPKTDINAQNASDETALIIAIKTNQKDIVELLINDKRFDPEESRLNLAFIYADLEISKLLISLSSLDVNPEFEVQIRVEYDYDETENRTQLINALTKAVETNNVDKIDLIINHPSFDKDNIALSNSIFLAAQINNTNAFRKLIQVINNDINIHNNDNMSLLVFAAKAFSGDIIDEIFNNPQFDPKSDQICQAFVESYSRPTPLINQQFNPQMMRNQNPNQILNPHLIPPKSSLIEIMNKILNYDNEHEHLIDFKQLLPNGQSFFTSIRFDPYQINLVCDFLLEHGVDPNMPDDNGIYPLENAIIIGSLELVTSLVNSNKIIYSKLKEGNTYLHIAAANSNSKILGFLLKKDVIDINSTNSINNTPLMEACRMKFSKNVDLLFDNDNLDYLHCNNFGKDALSIITSLPQNEHDIAKMSKEAYHNKIDSILASTSSFNRDRHCFGFSATDPFAFMDRRKRQNNNDREDQEEEEEED